MRRTPSLLTGLLVTAAVALAGCGSASKPPGVAASHVQQSPHAARANATSGVLPGHVRIHWHTVVSGLSSPLMVTSARDGSGRLFVDQQGGSVRVVRSGHVLPTPYLDISSEVQSGGEQGLLSIAFHPNFTKHPRFFAAYTRSNGDLIVSSFRATSASANHISATTEKHLLVVPHRGATNHNGGQIFFGRKGNLFITTGDGGSEGDTFKRADFRDNLTGKVLRIDVDHHCGTKNYCIPSGNPYATSTKYRREVLDWGLRNPWRVSMDSKTGKLWIGDVGQDRYEEIDTVGVSKAHDFGWSCREARATYNSGLCDHRTMTGPVAVIPHSPGGNCAIIGGFVYRGKAYASIAGGLYVFSDNCSGTMWGLRKNSSGKYVVARIGSVSGNPSGFGISGTKTLYVTTLDGILHRATFTKV
jgi:glucose/arabinose dehydrogenase